MNLAAPETVLLRRTGGARDGEPALRLRRVYSAALERAAVPFVLSGDGCAGGAPGGDGEDDELILELEGTDLRWRWRPPRSRGLGELALDAPPGWSEYLRGLGGARPARFRLTGGGDCASAEVVLTDPWWWDWRQDTLAALPVLVTPYDGVVRQVTFAARRGHADFARSAAEALFALLRDEYELAYQPPRLAHPNGPPPLQPLRAPHRVVFDLLQRRGEATCIDLVLFLAGCLEAADQAPVLIVVPDGDGQPSHALLAWWRDRAQRYRPVIGQAELLARWRGGDLAGVETTRLCHGLGAPFAQAAQEALDRLAGEPRAVGVDVRAARPPLGRAHELDVTCDSAVPAAIAAAEAAAHGAGASVVETLHLFTGLVAENGPICARLLAVADLDREELLARCRASAAGRPRSGGGGHTRGFGRCLDDARHNARSQGGTVIRESDLWWAVLSLPSASLRELLDDEASTRATLVSALDRVAPLPRIRSSLD